MRADLHTHSIFSDGESIPAEIVRFAKEKDHNAIAITDHVDMTNVRTVVEQVIKAVELSDSDIKVIPGVEITHVPPSKMDKVIEEARRYGAEWIVVHGETVTEPVAYGTDLQAAKNPEVDVLAHPGFISEEAMQAAKDNDVLIEITGRAGHNITNGYVAAMARKFDAKMIVDSDAHSPYDYMDEKRAYFVAMGAGLTKAEADLAIQKTPFEAVRKL